MYDVTNGLLVNSYVQSTGADVSLLGFKKILDLTENKKIIPLFLIMDAMLVDVHDDDLMFLKAIRSVKIDRYDANFPINMKKVT